MRTQQQILSIIKKYNILIRTGDANTEEGIRFKKLTLNCDLNDISKQEEQIATFKGNIQTERTHRWKAW
eukprot:2213029-Heterocapsa_arctica.AAC.1